MLRAHSALSSCMACSSRSPGVSPCSLLCHWHSSTVTCSILPPVGMTVGFSFQHSSRHTNFLVLARAHTLLISVSPGLVQGRYQHNTCCCCCRCSKTCHVTPSANACMTSALTSPSDCWLRAIIEKFAHRQHCLADATLLVTTFRLFLTLQVVCMHGRRRCIFGSTSSQ